MACEEAPGLVAEKPRLDTVGATFLGIKGDQTHDYGYHLCDPQGPDYSEQGALNAAVGPYACAIDIGMDWPAARAWLAWLITEIREDRITGIAEVIGSLDGKNVRYWSDYAGWEQAGVPYTGSGHDTWTHVAIYRSTAKTDHRLLVGWGPNGIGDTVADDDFAPNGRAKAAGDRNVGVLASDLWGFEWHGVSPYDSKSKSGRQVLLERLDAGIKTLVDRDPEAIELEDADIVAIADQVVARLLAPGGLADQVADRVIRLLAARLDPRQ